jgi:hypothetical protein
MCKREHYIHVPFFSLSAVISIIFGNDLDNEGETHQIKFWD